MPSNLEPAVMRLVEEVRSLTHARTGRLMSEACLWNELVACILGSNVKFEQAQSFACHPSIRSCLDMAMVGRDYDTMEAEVTEALSRPIACFGSMPGKMQRYRFPALRAKCIRLTAQSIYGKGKTIRGLLDACKTPLEARQQLTRNACGIGPKQASLFLRNTGYADNIAILDTHVIHYMLLVGLVTSKPKDVSGLPEYERVETTLQDYAKRLNAKLAHLDTAIWVVMRVYQRECKA